MAIGEEELIPTLPLVRMVRSDAPEEDTIANGFIPPPTPWTARVAIGEEELIPILPLVRMVNIEDAAGDEDTTEKGFEIPLPWIVNLEAGVDVPIPIFPLAYTLSMFDVCAEEILKIEEVEPVEDANTDSEP